MTVVKLTVVSLLFVALPSWGAVRKSTPPPVDLRAKAAQELPYDVSEKAGSELGVSPATVVATPPIEIEPPADVNLMLTALVQSWQPEGEGRLTGLESYDLGNLGSHPMYRVEAHWTPFVLVPPLGLRPMPFGFYGGFSFAYSDVTITAPTGLSLGQTTLYSMTSEMGASFEAPLWRQRLAMGLKSGVGRLDLVQASESNLANFAMDTTYYAVGAYARLVLLPAVSVLAGADFRERLDDAGDPLGLQRWNFLVGLAGEL